MHDMKRTVLRVTVCWFSLATFALHAQTSGTPQSASTGTPKIHFSATTFDFGKVNVGSVVRATFDLTNTGTAPLEIKDVRPGCGCTSAGTWERRIEPGNTTTLALQLNTANFGGTLSKSATVTCNDPAQPTVTLIIKGDVWKPIDVQPTLVVFNPASVSNDVRVVRVVNNTDEMITHEEPASSSPTFKPTLKVLKPGKEFELTIALIPPLAVGTVQGSITVKTSSTNMPQISAMALATVPSAARPQSGAQQPQSAPAPSLSAAPLTAMTPERNPIDVQPGVVVFNSASGSAGTDARVVRIVNNTDERITLEEPSSSSPSFQASLKVIRPGQEFELHVTAVAPLAAGSVQGIITMVTSSARMPRIAVFAMAIGSPAGAQPLPTTAALPTPVAKATPSAP